MKIICPHCSQALNCPETKLGGHTITCPRCKGQLTTPLREETPQLVATNTRSSSSSDSILRRIDRSLQQQTRMGLAQCIILGILTLAIVGYIGLTEYRIYTVFSAIKEAGEEFKQNFEQDFEQDLD